MPQTPRVSVLRCKKGRVTQVGPDPHLSYRGITPGSHMGNRRPMCDVALKMSLVTGSVSVHTLFCCS